MDLMMTGQAEGYSDGYDDGQSSVDITSNDSRCL